jgi:mRNA interferase RelE/StbE
MSYGLEILRTAQKQLAQITQVDRDRIVAAIMDLADVPRPVSCKKLSGRPGWRIRVGSYRVIYEIHDDKLLILVVTVGHRREVYR